MSTPVCNPIKKKVLSPKTPGNKRSPIHKGRSSSSPRGKKNTLGNLTPRTQPFAKKAHKHFHVKLAVENAYPAAEDLSELVLDAFKKGMEGCEEKDEFVKRYRSDPIYRALLVDVVSPSYYFGVINTNPNDRLSVV